MLMLLLREVDCACAENIKRHVHFNLRKDTRHSHGVLLEKQQLAHKKAETHLDCNTTQTDRLTAGQCRASEPVLQYKQTVRHNSTVSVQRKSAS
jgi:hypothetical protein